MIILFVLGFNHVSILSHCVIDRCEGNFCLIETPSGVIDIERKQGYEEGMSIECPVDVMENGDSK